MKTVLFLADILSLTSVAYYMFQLCVNFRFDWKTHTHKHTRHTKTQCRYHTDTDKHVYRQKNALEHNYVQHINTMVCCNYFRFSEIKTLSPLSVLVAHEGTVLTWEIRVIGSTYVTNFLNLTRNTDIIKSRNLQCATKFLTFFANLELETSNNFAEEKAFSF